jgi:DNA-binding GntR family transcriptional regulator
MRVARAGLSFADQAEQALREQIVSGRRQPGQRLNEVELSAELGVSRGPVREAMQRLARDGLVHMEAHRGAFVRRLDHDDVLALYEVRISLETTAAQLAASRRTEDDIQRIGALLDTTSAEVRGRPDPHYPTDLDLHRLIGVVAGNDRLYRLIDGINSELTLVRAASGFRPDRAPVALDEHTELAAAIVAGSSSRAGRLMTTHLRQSLANTLRILAEQPDEDS